MLHDFIGTNRDELVSRTTAKVAARPRPIRVRRRAGARGPSLPDPALGMGFTVSQVVHDYGDICANGGELHTRNVAGKGCVFTIELPQASVPSA